MSGRPNRREGAAHAANRREGAASTTPRRPASQTCLPLWERRPRRDLPALVGAPPPARSGPPSFHQDSLHDGFC
jgi:hypothetical protein